MSCDKWPSPQHLIHHYYLSTLTKICRRFNVLFPHSRRISITPSLLTIVTILRFVLILFHVIELLLSSTFSEYRSPVADSHNRYAPSFVQQPIMNPTEGFLNRTIDICPTHLTGDKRTRWLKARSESNYDATIHVHHRTYQSHLLWATNKITDV